MGHYSWLPMDPAAAAALSGTLPLPTKAAETNGAGYYVDPTMFASVVPGMVTAPPAVEMEAAKRRHEESVAICLVHHLVTCTGAIQAGDYASASGSLNDARRLLKLIPVDAGIGRVVNHFANALSQRLFPAFPNSGHPQQVPPADDDHAGELFHQFYEAGPHLKFAHFTANQAILKAFEGCDRVHVVDLALMQGVQWPPLIQALALRPGGPPSVRLTGIGPPSSGDGDVLHGVGIYLAELAKSLNVPLNFRGVAADRLEGLRPWMFTPVPGEAVAVNSILQLHRLLVDPDAATTSLPAPIDVVLEWIVSMQPKVFTVVEQEADHNKTSLLDRFTNALFYYGAMFDSLDAVTFRAGAGGAGIPGSALAEAYLQREILDIVSGEGSSRVERHELLPRWRERLRRAGLTQLPFGPYALRQATMQLGANVCGAGYCVQDNAGCLALAWHDRPLYTTSVWRASATTERKMDAIASSSGGGGGVMQECNNGNSSKEQ